MCITSCGGIKPTFFVFKSLSLHDMKKYVDVIVPFPLANYYTYSVPDEMSDQIRIGCRVVVQFGMKRFYTAIVANVHYCKPEGFEVKDVSALLDAEPVLLPTQFKLWKWIAEYYLCTQGDVYKAALPSGLKLESETMVALNPDFEAEHPLPEREQKLLDLLSVHPEQSVTRLEKESGYKNTLLLVKALIDREAVWVKEEVKRTYKPKMEARVRLCGSPTQQQLNVLFDSLARSKKQLEILMCYVQLSGMFGREQREVTKKDLLAKSGAGPSSLKELERKRIVEVYYSDVGHLKDFDSSAVVPMNELNRFQQTAYDGILESFKQKNVCLLNGVTSSGKTEVYIHLIKQAVDAGKQVLYLLPEIALTTQITTRLQRVFGNRLGVYHSKFPDAERVEIWQKQLSDEPYSVILGVRSAVFLPFRNLGLIIVDEEHENTYKQQDPAPRYHARNTAIVLATMYDAKVLLGTATPSVESWYNATHGKYGLVELKERYQEIQLPEIVPVDIKELHRKKRMNGQFSPLLVKQIQDALDNKEQVILFQNRRGFAPMVECRTCGWVPRCRNCDVSLTYHKGINQLTCHYCGYTYQLPLHCPACDGVELVNRGFGTEKIEEAVKELFPGVKVGRMDLDTTRSRSAYERIIDDFTEGKTQILVGTQMVSKGLDFDRVSVVGILNADSMLNYPDFRSYERAYQLMAQVAGRAGRKSKQGRVILQTKSIDHPIIRQVMENDFEGMVADQLAERELFHYPPFYRLIYVYLKHRKEDLLDEMAAVMGDKLRQVFGARVLGPDKPPVGRVQTLFIRKMVLKIELNASTSGVRSRLIQIQREMIENERYRSLIVYYDVDPM